MRVAVIGSGIGGLATAWLLDERCDVTLFEASDRLGGHAHTVGGVDTGIHLFHPREFSRFTRLLERLDAPTRSGLVRVTFHDRRRDEHTILPPLRQRFPHMPFGRFGPLRTHLAITRLLRLGSRLVSEWDTQTTLAEFFHRTKLPADLLDEFLAPLTAAMWGLPSPAEMRDFSALVPLWYLTRLRFWASEIVGGTQAYISRLVASLRRTEIAPSTPAFALERGPRWTVHHAHGRTGGFDHVVLATNATQARHLVSGDAAAALSGFRYYDTRIAVHGDTTVMPATRARWSYCNIAYDGDRSTATLWKGQWDDQPIFTSWVHDATPPMADVRAVVKFEHPYMTPLHFTSQRRLHALQGRDHLWFAGVYTGGVDSHESGVASAIRVASRLAPGGRRLAELADAENPTDEHHYREVA
jgi:predicted NAD/FAD-binding protein